jgi:hypothetical protein
VETEVVWGGEGIERASRIDEREHVPDALGLRHALGVSGLRKSAKRFVPDALDTHAETVSSYNTMSSKAIRFAVTQPAENLDLPPPRARLDRLGRGGEDGVVAAAAGLVSGLVDQRSDGDGARITPGPGE